MNPEDMITRVREEGLLAAGRPVVVLLSGGRDSTCLLDVAVRVTGASAVMALHVNYGIRESAGEDDRHCHQLCASVGVALEVSRPRLPGNGTASMRAGQPYRIAVIGGGQSAAEMAWAARERFGEASVTMVMRTIGLANYATSRFTNELYFPSFVDEFYAAPVAIRERVLAQMHATNYSGLDSRLLDALYEQAYIERVTGQQRLCFLANTDVVAARLDGDELVLTLAERLTGRTYEFRCDRVLLGTGFCPEMPALIGDLITKLGLNEAAVGRQYRLAVPDCDAACYLQGVNEATHGIADSLLSVVAIRAGEIVTDILAHRQAA